jgi:Tol biopolymer transport system component
VSEMFPSSFRVTVLTVVAAGCAAIAIWAAMPAGAAPASLGRIVYVSNSAGNNDIYSINVDGTDERALTSDASDEFDPAWSPDGRTIAFVRDAGGNRDIWVMNSDGSGQARLTSDPASDRYPGWSPDSSAIVFRSNRRPSTSFDIWKMQADGSNAVRITADSGLWGQSFETDPTWSADGLKIAFVSDRDGNREIYTANADGSSPRRLTDNPAADQFPAWSPDGSTIAFGSDRDGNEEIYVMSASDGSGQTNLTANPATDRYPAWSPDGAKIAFRSSRAHGFDIFLMNRDGSDVTQLTYGLGRTMQPGFEGSGLNLGSSPSAVDGPGGSGAPTGGSNGGSGSGHDRAGAGRRGATLRIWLTSRKQQRILGQRGVVVRVRCSAACPFKLSGSVRVDRSRTRIALKGTRGHVAADKRTTVQLRLTGKRLKRVARLLAAGRRLRAVVSLTAGGSRGTDRVANAVVRCRR